MKTYYFKVHLKKGENENNLIGYQNMATWVSGATIKSPFICLNDLIWLRIHFKLLTGVIEHNDCSSIFFCHYREKNTESQFPSHIKHSLLSGLVYGFWMVTSFMWPTSCSPFLRILMNILLRSSTFPKRTAGCHNTDLCLVSFHCLFAFLYFLVHSYLSSNSIVVGINGAKSPFPCQKWCPCEVSYIPHSFMFCPYDRNPWTSNLKYFYANDSTLHTSTDFPFPVILIFSFSCTDNVFPLFGCVQHLRKEK